MKSSSEADPRGTLTDQVVGTLKARVGAAFRTCMNQAPTNLDNLHDELNKFQSQVGQRDDSDQMLAEDLVERCQRLLAKASIAPHSEAARLARAAVMYVVTLDDASSDAMSLLPLEDDLEVVRAVERVLERT